MSNTPGLVPLPPDDGDAEGSYQPGDEEFGQLETLHHEAREVARRNDYEAGQGLMRGRRKPRPLEQYTLEHDKYDEMEWRRIRKDNPDLDKLLKEAKPAKTHTEPDPQTGQDVTIVDEPGTGPWPFPDHLAMDLYTSLYQAYPQLHEEMEMDPAYLINRVAMEAVMDSTDYGILHATTVLDPFAAAIGTSSLADQVLKNQELMEAAQQLADDLPPEQQDGESDRQYAQRLRAWNDQQAAARRVLRTMIKQALQQAQDEVDVANNALGAFGGHEPGMGEGQAIRTTNAKEKMRLAQKVMHNEQLRQIVQFAGRFRKIALSAQKSRIEHTPDEVYSITQGSDISRVVPSELIKLDDPYLEMLFFRDMLENRLPIYELNYPAKLGRGPIIVAIDESGSMSGTNDAWAKAAFLALHGIAKSQQRDILLIHFAAGSQVKTETYLASEPSDPNKLIESCLHFYAGGTDYDPWMRVALQAIEQSQWNKADVICISDGAAFISDGVLQQWVTNKRDREFRCYGILIQDWGGPGTLEQIADEFAILRSSYIGDGQKDGDVLFRAFSV